MQNFTKTRTVLPRFLETRELQLSVDTSGFCQARCELCVWPYFTPSKQVMTLDEFATVLDRFAGFDFFEFGFNSINEPFTDATIIEKMNVLIESPFKINSLFFSSNWLIPKPKQIERFVSTIDAARKSERVTNISINATASGIDEDSYDKYQAGRDLKNTVAKYKPLDFALAVQNITKLIETLSTTIPIGSGIMIRIKGYGEDFDQETYDKFWRGTLLAAGIDQKWVSRHVKTIVNHGLTTFGRHTAQAPSDNRECEMNWLDEKIVVGYDGNLGLCCQESARKVQLGSLLTHTLNEIIESDPFQKNLAVVRGNEIPDKDSLCSSCEWYTSQPAE